MEHMIGRKVLLPDDSRGEIIKVRGYEWPVLVLTNDGRKVNCHPIRLRPAVEMSAATSEEQ